MRVCTKALSCVAVDNYYVVTTDCDLPIRIYFITKDIVRIRAGFDGDFQESSYSLVTTAWPSVTDEVLKDYRKRVEVAVSTLEENDNEYVLRSEGLIV